MKRRVVIVAVFLLAGAIVNVAVAWGVVVRPMWADMPTAWEHVDADWPLPVAQQWRLPQRLMTKRSLGVVVHQYVRIEDHRLEQVPRSESSTSSLLEVGSR